MASLAAWTPHQTEGNIVCRFPHAFAASAGVVLAILLGGGLVSMASVGVAAEHLKVAEQAAKEGRYANADEAYLKAIAATKSENPKDTYRLAKILLAQARNLQKWRSADPKAPDVSKRLEGVYREVIYDLHVSPEDREEACNNLGVYLLNEGKPQDAVKVFAEVPDPRWFDAHVYLANYAWALEVTKQPEEAVKRFSQSLTRKPEYTRAADGIIRILKAGTLRPVAEMLGVKSLFGVEGLPVTAGGDAAYELLAVWGNGESADLILPYLIRYFARFPVDVTRFEEVEKPRLLALTNVWKTQPSWLTELLKLYEYPTFPELPTTAEIRERDYQALPNLAKSLPKWAVVHERATAEVSSFRRDFARVLQLAGDGFRVRAAPDRKPKDSGLARQAIARYLTAYSVDRTFPEPPLAAVATLVTFRTELDPKYEFLNAYAGLLLHQKEGLKQHAQATKSRDDYIALSALHVLLAHTFEAEAKWGRSEEDRAGAIFHWLEAIQDEGEIRRLSVVGLAPTFSASALLERKEVQYPISPDLRYRLAHAYLKCKLSDRKEKAGRQLIEATELYVNIGQKALAVKLATEIRAIAEKEALGESVLRPLQELERAATDSQLPVWEKITKSIPDSVMFADGDTILFRIGTSLLSWGLAKDRQLDDADYLWFDDWIAKKAAKAPIVATYRRRIGIDLWSINEGRLRPNLFRKEIPASRIVGLAITPDGHTVAVLDHDGDMQVWDDKTDPPTSPRPGFFRRAVPNPTAIDITPDGTHLVVAGGRDLMPQLAYVERSNGKVTLQSYPPEAAITALAVSPFAPASPSSPVMETKLYAVTGDADGEIRIYRYARNELVKKFQAHSGPKYDGRPQPAAVRAILFHPDGKWLATLGDDHTVRIWDYLLKTPKELARFGHLQQPYEIAISPDGWKLGITTPYPNGGVVTVWDVSLLR